MRRAVSPLRGEARPRKRFCPPNALSSLKSVTATLRGLVCRSSSPSFLLGLAVGGRVRLSPFAARPFAAGKPHVRRHSCFSPAVLAFNIILSIRFHLLSLTILIIMNNNYTTFINVSLSLPSLTHTHTHRTILETFVTDRFR